jgi:hypothetical protein
MLTHEKLCDVERRSFEKCKSSLVILGMNAFWMEFHKSFDNLELLVCITGDMKRAALSGK